jgi:hypothetical protein
VPQWEALEGALLEAGMRDGCGGPGACANPLSQVSGRSRGGLEGSQKAHAGSAEVITSRRGVLTREPKGGRGGWRSKRTSMRNWKGCSGGPSFRWGQGFSLHVELEQPRAGFIGFERVTGGRLRVRRYYRFPHGSLRLRS